MTGAVESANRPNAMPELWTWRIAKGPTRSTTSPSSSCLATTCFVSWSATTAAVATTASAAHWNRPAPSRRSAPATGWSAFGAEPTRISGARRAGPGSATPLLTAAALQAQRGVGQRLEALLRDHGAAPRAGAVRAGRDALERAVDL